MGDESSMNIRPSVQSRSSGIGLHLSALRYWWVVLLTVAIALGSTAWFARQQAPTYRATATLVLAPIVGLADTREITDALNTLDRRSVVASLAMVPSSRTVKEQARAELKLSDAQLKLYAVQTAVVPDTNVIEVNVEGPNPRVDAALASAVAAQSIARTPVYYDIYVLKVLDWPIVPTEAIGPGLVRKLTVGGLIGLVVGTGAALLLGFASDHAAGARLSALVRKSIGGGRQRGQGRPRRVMRGVHLVEASEEPEVHGVRPD